MEYYSANDKISDFVRQSALAPFAERLNFYGGIRAPFFYRVKIKNIWAGCEAYRHADVLNGINAAQAQIERGEGFAFELYEERDRAREPSLNEAALFRFHAKDGAPYALVLAGGAYMSVCSLVEGFPVAAALNRAGYNAFVLVYRHGKNHPFPVPLADLKRAISLIGERAEEWKTAREGYAVYGFSAGANLAAQLGMNNVGLRDCALPPAMLALCYPAIEIVGCKHIFGIEKAAWGKDKSKYAFLKAESDILAHIDERSYPVFT